MFRKNGAGRAQAQPWGLFTVGLTFLAIGMLSYPAFLAAGIVFLIVGLRGLRDQREEPSRGGPGD
ncbi:MAG: hypothetical protein GWM87_10515 [Xanthomonadales bacterium]|nr:hypothetical protein [Xanthomonadales bacterium]NIX13320.1 hypothetical protein [Xanthomonadales bacterium]